MTTPSRLLSLVRLATLLAAAWLPASATVTLPALLSDHAVLQSGAHTRIWGLANPGEAVKVALAGVSARATADASGHWETFLGNLPAGGPHELMVTGADQRPLVVRDVLLGEVWLGSGQSNIGFTLAHAKNQAEIDAATDGQIRFFIVPKTVAFSPATSVEAKWVVCSPKTASAFSAVGYYFATNLRARLGAPVGMIISAIGGTDIMPWVPRPEFDRLPELALARHRWATDVTRWPVVKKHYDESYAAWQKKRDASIAAGEKPAGGEPREERGPGTFWEPAALYNGMIAPLAGVSIRGFLWYQGENNVGEANYYSALLQTLIRTWRAAWHADDLPFVIMQLPGCRTAEDQPGDSTWAELREAQQQAAALPHAAYAVTADLGRKFTSLNANQKLVGNLHPPDKREFARRLALQALCLANGLPASEAFGPVFRTATLEGSSLHLSFDHAAGLVTTDQRAPQGFALAGANHRFYWAEARIDGDTIILTSPKVTDPVAVRYGWADLPDLNLTNGIGLPLAPFRTDWWPRAGRATEDPN